MGSGGGGVVGCQLLMLSQEMQKSKIPIFAEGGGGWQPTFRSQLQIFKVKSLAEISISAGGGGGGRGREGHGMHGISCCHLAFIWGELTDFDTKFCNTF